MEGGNSQQGCGYNPWLYSCCMQNSQTTVRKRNPNYNQPSKLMRHDDIHKTFSRRRYDSSENQLVPTCGIPTTPSNTLQKRIIGGRPAHFAEHPWQSHIRIKEYQCGGGNWKALVREKHSIKPCAHAVNLSFIQCFQHSCLVNLSSRLDIVFHEQSCVKSLSTSAN